MKYLNLDGLKQLFGKGTNLTVLTMVLFVILAAAFKKAGITLFGIFLIYLLFSPFVVKRLRHN